jgi:3'(2'), 5'-bisphosphate nucleotidase
LGRTLGENHGIVACFKDLHPQVLEAIKKTREEEEKTEEKENPPL